MKYVRLDYVEELLDTIKIRDMFYSWSNEWEKGNREAEYLLRKLKDEAIEIEDINKTNKKYIREGTQFITPYGAIGVVIDYDVRGGYYECGDEFGNELYVSKNEILDNLL